MHANERQSLNGTQDSGKSNGCKQSFENYLPEEISDVLWKTPICRRFWLRANS
jgi:hypothetical protein